MADSKSFKAALANARKKKRFTPKAGKKMPSGRLPGRPKSKLPFWMNRAKGEEQGGYPNQGQQGSFQEQEQDRLKRRFPQGR